MKLHKFLTGLIALAMVAGCTKKQTPDTPEKALEQYVSAAFSAKNTGDRQKLVDLSAGDALAYISSMDNETFQKHFVDSKLEMVNMKTRDLRQENSGDVSLVYELSYREGKDPTRVVHTNKKIAYLTQDKTTNHWKIKATKNLKSFVERKEDLVVPPNTPETTEQENAPGEQKN
jgi:hypothetical protein